MLASLMLAGDDPFNVSKRSMTTVRNAILLRSAATKAGNVVSLVAATIDAGAAGGQTTDAIDTTGATLLVATVSWYNTGSNSVTLTDSKGNTWTRVINKDGNNSQSCAIYYSKPTSVGVNHTLTLAGTTIYSSCKFYAFTGPEEFVIDTSASATGDNVATLKPGSVTPSTDRCLLVTCSIYYDIEQQATINGGFTGTAVPYVSGASMPHGSAYLIQGAAAASDPTWTFLGTAASASAAIVVFKPAKRINVNNANLFWSPYNWDSNGSGSLQANNAKSDATYVRTATPGAYLKTRFSGTAITLEFDHSLLTAASVNETYYPEFEYKVDSGSWTRVSLDSTKKKVTLGGYSDATHTIEVHIVSARWYPVDRWTTPVMSVTITGLLVDAGRNVSAATLRTNRIMCYGDSNSEGHELLGVGVTKANQQARLAWPALMAAYLDAEYGIAGYSGQGYVTNSGVDDDTTHIPDCEDAWDFYSNARSRLVSGAFSPAPNYILSAHGQNDSGQNVAVATAVDNLVAEWRAAAPSAKLFFIVAPTQDVAVGVSNGITSAADANAFLVDTTVNYHGTPAYLNGSHLSQAGHAQYAADAWAIMEALL